VPQILRRRVGALGRQALKAAWTVAPQGARTVFASRHGEFDRTLGILEQLARDEAPSPAEFSLSVHHALAGLLSIATSDTQGHTAVAAGRESALYGLLEAVALLAEAPDRPVLLVHADEPLPEPFCQLDDGVPEEPLAFALLLEAGDLRLSVEPSTDLAPSPRPALDLLGFLLSRAPGICIEGDRLRWTLAHA
jgi:hypothetical protein